MKDKKGQVVFYTLMVGITLIILGLALATPVKEFVDTARNSSNMDCDNSSISKYTQAGCVATDLTLMYFVAGLIFLGGAVVAARKFI